MIIPASIKAKEPTITPINALKSSNIILKGNKLTKL